MKFVDEINYIENRIKNIITNLSQNELAENYRQNQENALDFYVKEAKIKAKQKP